MTEAQDTWQARLRRGVVQATVFALVLYPLIAKLDLCMPREALEISTGNVVLHFARLYFIFVGVAATVKLVFDWFARLRKFLVLRRAQEKSMS
jgi:hypothetical protein